MEDNHSGNSGPPLPDRPDVPPGGGGRQPAGVTRRAVVTGTSAVVLAALMVGCDQTAAPATTEGAATPPPTTTSPPPTPLPTPQTGGSFTLEAALAQRRSHRTFATTPLSTEDLGQLLWAAQGINQDDPSRRTAPSAGALYPLTMYAATAAGTHRYVPVGHSLVLQVAGDTRPALQAAALDQTSVGSAAAVIVITADFAISAARYGEATGERYSILEAGHLAQNILLEVVALGLGAVPIGPIDLAGIRRALALPTNEEPVYLIPVGHPA